MKTPARTTVKRSRLVGAGDGACSGAGLLVIAAAEAEIGGKTAYR